VILVAEAAPDLGLQIWTLVIAAFAALAAVFAAILSAVSASKRDRSQWLRQEQTVAYETFSAAAWAALDEITLGAVGTALHDPDFTGLDEAITAVESHSPKLYDAARRIAVVGGSEVAREVLGYTAEWTHRSGLAVPLSGAAHQAAHEQRGFYIQHFTARLLRLAETMRDDLGLLSKKDRKILSWNREVVNPPLPDMHFDDAQPGEANRVLRKWKVRTWEADPTVGPDYRRDDTPWALMDLPHNELFQPLVAVLRKLPRAAWILAIDSSMTPEQVDLIERDAATLVTTFGRSGETRYGGKTWLSGVVPGERIYWWPESEAPKAQ
jgi:hypothetical protein